MKILIFSLVYYPKYIGGAEVAIKEITDRISPQEIQFDMITIGKKNSVEKIGNVTVHTIGLGSFTLSKYTYPFLAYFKASKLHAQNKYDSVWAMMASYAGFAAYLFKRNHPEIPFILSLQEGDNFEIRQGIFNFLFRRIFATADYIQVISKFLLDWARTMGAASPVVIIPNAVDFALFNTRMSHVDQEKFKSQFGKKTEDIFLITTGRLVLKNATGDIIDSLTYLPENIKLLILGVGYEESMLKEKVQKLGLQNRVQFLGFIAHSNMPQYLHAADIFIRPSLSEGFGNSYIEAMAAGIPVIATPVGGIVDFIQDGVTGLFCEVRNPRSIAQKVEKLMKDKESYDFIVKNGITLAKEKYEWSLIASDMKNKVFLKTL